MVDCTRDWIETFPQYHLHKVLQRMITFNVDRILEAKMKTERTLATEEILTNTIETSYAASNAGLKDALYQYIENILTEMTLQVTLNHLFVRTLEQ